MKKINEKLIKKRIVEFKKKYTINADCPPTLTAMYIALGVDRKNWARDIDVAFDRTSSAGRKKATVIKGLINGCVDWVEQQLLESAFKSDRSAVMKYWSVAFMTRYNQESQAIPPINITLASGRDDISTIIVDNKKEGVGSGVN